MSFIKRRADEADAGPAKRRSDELSDTDATESEPESEYEEGRLRPRRHRKSATGIGRRLVKRRRADRAEVREQRRAQPRAVTPPSRSTLEESLEVEGEVSEEGEEIPQSSTPTFNDLLKWKGIPYPGLPQIGYAFSYASGPISFLKVPASAAKSLAAHWRPPQNYVAYVIYSLHPSPYMDSRLQGLELVNELAARGFIEDDECDISEETVQASRALCFKKGNVVVSIPKLGGATAFKGYWPGSQVDEEDRKMVSERLQSVVHDRAVPKETCRLMTSPSSTQCSNASGLRGTTLTVSENEGDTSSSSGRDTRIEDSGLIKFVKVHWRHSKWIADNIHLIRPHQYTHLRTSTSSADTEGDDFKAVIVWSNKKEKKQGINLLERVIAERLGGNEKESMKDVMVCEETIDDEEEWLVFHKNDVVVAFPGPEGDTEFLESVQAREKVWR